MGEIFFPADTNGQPPPLRATAHSIPVPSISTFDLHFDAAIKLSQARGTGQRVAGPWDGEEADDFGQPEPTPDEEDLEFKEMAANFERIANRGDWWPFKNKQADLVFVCWLFLISLFANFRRRPVSREMLQMFLLFAKILGAPNIPSYHAYSREMERVQNLSNEPPLERRDFLNPCLSSSLCLYPRRGAGLKDLFDGDFLNHHLPHSLATPMVRSGSHDFYIFEPVQCLDGDCFTTLRWFKEDDEMWGEGYPLEVEEGSYPPYYRQMEGQATEME
ncbi:hypothetical protein JCM5296_004244 [Sporobolomyces johnsonii]